VKRSTTKRCGCAALEESGLDHGPISVHDKMRAMGLPQVPSTASLARIFRQAGVARLEPKKKPRSAWRRFVYPAPNACWQLDATEYVLTGGRTCVIFQLIDDHSRYTGRLHRDRRGGDHRVRQGPVRPRVPQRLLSDNGVALNPSRRGYLGQLVAHVSRLGVETITGKPHKPTTQGKNELVHQTLFSYLDKQPLADSLAELQAQIDGFDHIYNTERPHQGLPGRVTPAKAWQATEKAEAPPAQTRAAVLRPSDHETRSARAGADRPGRQHHREEADQRRHLHPGQGHLPRRRPVRPAAGITHVGNGQRRGRRPNTTETSPKS
jgi:putative transposase